MAMCDNYMQRAMVATYNCLKCVLTIKDLVSQGRFAEATEQVELVTSQQILSVLHKNSHHFAYWPACLRTLPEKFFCVKLSLHIHTAP